MSEETSVKTGNPYLMPGAIVIAGVCIALAIYTSNGVTEVPVNTNEYKEIGAEDEVPDEDLLAITESDHVYGPEDPDVYFIEYSDYRCGYCGLFHDTIKQMLEEYDGRVAWVYRHTPYQSGGKEAAVASECIAEQLGEDSFWAYTEAALANQRGLSESWSKGKALELGVDEGTYDECIASGRYDDLIAAQVKGMQQLGGRGTPYNVLLTRENGVLKFSGAQSLENVKIFVEKALKTLDE